MNLLALAGSSYENTARGILYVIYEMLWKLMYYVLTLIDEITKLFYKVAGINVSDGVVENKNMLEQLLNNNIVSSWYWWFILIAAALVIVFTMVAIIKAMATDKEEKRSMGPILKNVGLAMLLLVFLGPIMLVAISLVSNFAILVAEVGGNSSISISDIIFGNSGNLITVYNETYAAEITSFRELGNDFLYDLVYNPSLKEGATALTFHWYIALLGGGFVLYNLVCMVIEMVKRIFNIVILYIGSPFAISKLALDDGKSFKEWQNRLFHEFILFVAQMGTFMIFVALVNVLNNIDFEGIVSNDTEVSEPNLGILEPEETPETNTETVSTTFSLLNGLGRTLVIMAAVSVTRSSATMFADLLTVQDSKNDTLLEGLLSKLSTRGTGVRTRTITRTANTTKRETVFVEQKVNPSFSSSSFATGGVQGGTNSSPITNHNNINQNVNVSNHFTSNNKFNNREVREGIKKGSYAQGNGSPANIYVNTTKRIEVPTTKANNWTFMDNATSKVASTIVKDYNKANSNLNAAISSGDKGKLQQTLQEYTKAYAKEAEVLSSNYRKFETRASNSLRSDMADQTKQELKNISSEYRRAQMEYSRTASKLKQYDGERISTADALKMKEQADKQRETLMHASSKAAQFYENQKKGE